jgi:hypothetical protein
MRITILLFLVVGFNFCAAQTNFTKEIIGTWKLAISEIVVMEGDEDNILLDESTYRKPDPLIDKDTILTFKSDETIIITVDDFELHATYTLKETLLTIGNRKFVLLKVTQDELIFKEKNDATGMKHTYKRIKNNE